MIHFDLSFTSSSVNKLQCSCVIEDIDLCKRGVTIKFPAWVPGSYLIRDFAKHIQVQRAFCNDKELSFHKEDKSTWKIEASCQSITVEYSVYLFDTSPRSGYLDNNRFFTDGCRIFPQIDGALDFEYEVSICRWKDSDKLYTTMNPKGCDSDGFGIYKSKSYWDLIEHPIAIGDFQSFEFLVHGIPHRCVTMDAEIKFDAQRLKNDITKICEGIVDFWGESPLDRYTFFLGVEENGYGGIEHTYSSSLLCSYNQLPFKNQTFNRDDYISLLGLFSHEYFHVWNVKRLKPSVYVEPDLSNPVYTKQLWIFEGITSYYDDLNLLKTGVINKEEYAKIIENNFNRLFQNYGRHNHSLEDSSFDAWIKLYQPNEDSINSSTSYYLKGAIIAFMLDLIIIQESNGAKCLQDVMIEVWNNYGKNSQGLPESEFENICAKNTKIDLKDFFDRCIRDTEDLDYKGILNAFGVEFAADKTDISRWFGFIFGASNDCVIRSVVNESNACEVGFLPGDDLIAINGHRVTKNNISNLLNRVSVGDLFSAIVFRRNMIKSLQGTLFNDGVEKYKVSFSNENQLQKIWLQKSE